MTANSSLYGEKYAFGAEEAQTGWRLDHFLALRLPALSRSRLQALIGEGHVSVAREGQPDAQTIKDPNKRVKTGEVLSVFVPAPKKAEPEGQHIPLTVVYEDADLIVIDKPAGLVVHPAAGNLDGTLVNALIAHCGESLKGIGGVARPGIAHRLDKDTSGLLVAAKTERAMRSLAKQFAAHAVERVYNAVVWGAPRLGNGHIEGNLGRNPFDRKRMTVLREGGKTARTNYRVLETFGAREEAHAKAFAALVECRLETGRTHQIRVHLAYLGHPLIGDSTYGRARKPPRPRTPEETLAFETAGAFPRQALHAGVLGFFHPTLQAKLRFESAWPADFHSLVNALEGLNLSGKP
jgi:23S rRNA pseudouridine1911/1915/1917 synthase